MSSDATVLLSALLAGCAAAPVAQQAAKPAALQAEASPLPVSRRAASLPRTAPASSGARLLDKAPPDLPAEVAERVRFLSDICPVALRYDAELEQGVAAGCRSCPPFEAPAAAPDGKIAVGGDEFFALELLLPGHFSDAASEQRLAVFNGCESHAANWGGTLLAEQSGGHFRSLSYASGIHPQACEVYRRLDGRDIAVCEFTDVHQSLATDSLSSLDYAALPPVQRELLTLTSRDGCLVEPGSKTAVTERIRSVEFGAGAQAGILSVHIERITHTLNADYDKYCQLQLNSDQRIEPPAGKHEQLLRRFRYDGRVFRAR